MKITNGEIIMNRKQLVARRAEYVSLRDAAQSRLLALLTTDVQKYDIGTQSVTHYNLDITKLREMITYYDSKIAEIDAALSGGGARKVVAVVERDW